MKPLRIMMIGAHPDDCDFCCGGTALNYSRAGHIVKFISMCNGNGGHQAMKPDDLAARRKNETQEVARYAGIEYDVWDIPDCELMADLETRKKLVREIREFAPDLIFCHRPNDYHADHRNSSILVQDASYLLIVPNFCPEVPAMKTMPVIVYFYDEFHNPPFRPDIVMRTDAVVDEKYLLLDKHVSQVYEWLPYTYGTLDEVPEGPEERLEWLHSPRVPRDGRPLDEALLKKCAFNTSCEYREAIPAQRYRKELIERYGEEAGQKILFAEAFEVCEYGSPLTEENRSVLFPF